MTVGFSGEAIATLWGAAATLASGVLAVIAASLFAYKQMRIAARQTEILAKQVDIERAKLAHDLYDRRYRAYDTTAALLIDTMSNRGDRPTVAIADAFFIAMTEARFLFPDGVHDQMFEIWTKVNGYFALERKMKSDHDNTGRYADGDPDRSYEITTWLHNRMVSLHDMFPQLRLSEGDKLMTI